MKTELVCQKILQTFVTKLLIFLGFSPRTCGFNHLHEMVVLSFNNSPNQNPKLAQLYLVLSKKYDQPPDAIQTAIRTALKNSYNHGGNTQLEILFGTKLVQAQHIIPPREFLALISVYLTHYWDGSPDLKIPNI